MKNILFLAVMVILGLIQACLFEPFKLANVKPDFLLMSALIAATFFAPVSAYLFSFCAGFFKDLWGVSAFGLNTLLFCFWCFLIIKLNRRMSVDDDYMRLALIVVITLLHNLIFGFTLVYSGSVVPAGIFLRIVIIETLYTAALFPFVLKISKPVIYP